MRRFTWAGLLLAGFLVLPLGGCNDGDDGSPTRESREKVSVTSVDTESKKNQS